MPKSIRTVVAGLALLVAVWFGAAGAAAQSLEALRATGAVGESYDGYAVAREASAGALVAEVNAKRKKIYEERAAAQGVPADQVGRVYAQQILDSAPKGTWFLTPEGKWIQK